MYNKHTTAVYAVVIASVLLASMFAISYVQQRALAQGNQTSGGAAGGGTNQSSSSSSNATSGGGTGGIATLCKGPCGPRT
jgi:uncharacterized membrane protein